MASSSKTVPPTGPKKNPVTLSPAIKPNNNNQTKIPSLKIDEGYTLFLEEAKGLPLLWNGQAPVSKIIWKLTPADEQKFTLLTIGEVLEKFTAQEYLKYATVSMSSKPEDFATIRLSDSFATLFNGNNSNGKGHTAKLIINEFFKVDPTKETSSKYILVITELNKKQVLWDGRKPVRNMIARVSENQMLQTVQTLLKKYLPTDYIKKNIQIQLVTDKRSVTSLKNIDLDDLLGTLFQGTSASIHIWNRDELDANENDEEEKAKSVAELEAFEKRSLLGSIWPSKSWTEIREEIQNLFQSFEVVSRERDLPSYFEQKMMEEKRSLETAMRRRNRNIDEVWRRYEVLKTTLESAAEIFKYKLNLIEGRRHIPSTVNGNNGNNPISRRGASEQPPPSESWDNLRRRVTTPSCIDVVTHSLHNFGIQIYDEDSRVSPFAGMAITFAVVVVICALTHYMG